MKRTQQFAKHRPWQTKHRERFRKGKAPHLRRRFFEGAGAAGMVRAPARTCSIHTTTGLPSGERESSAKIAGIEVCSLDWDPVETVQRVLPKAKTDNTNLFCTKVYSRKHKIPYTTMAHNFTRQMDPPGGEGVCHRLQRDSTTETLMPIVPHGQRATTNNVKMI